MFKYSYLSSGALFCLCLYFVVVFMRCCWLYVYDGGVLDFFL